MGFYKILVKHNKEKYNVLPYRDYNDSVKPLDWFNKHTFETYCTSVDLDVLEKHNHKFKIINGLEFEHKIRGDLLFDC